MSRLEQQRRYKSTRDVNLKLLRIEKIAKVKYQRSVYRKKVKKQQDRAEKLVRSKGDTKLQDKFTQKQLKRRQKQIKRNIGKQKKLKYQKHGGDIALGNSIEQQKWQTNFFSTNVWKFKIRGKNLMVAFLDGSIYMYFGAAKLFMGMVRAGSKGKYVWRQLRNKSVAYIKIK